MNKILLTFLFLFFSFNFASAQNLRLIQDSVYKYKDGIIYAVNQEGRNSIYVLYADSEDSARVLYYDLPCTGKDDYINLLINLKCAAKRSFSGDSEIKKIQENLLANIENYKTCPNNICKTTNDILQNHYSDHFLKLTVDESINQFVPNYKVRAFVKHVKKTVNHNVLKNVPKHSYKITLSFYVNTQNGKVENFKIINGEVLKKSEEKFINKAVKKSEPFSVPKEFQNVYDLIPVKIHFNWKVRTFY